MTGVVLALNLLMASVATLNAQIVASLSLLVPHGTIAELHVAVLPKKMMIQRSIQSLSLSLAQSHSQIQYLSLQMMIMCLAMTVLL